MRWILILCLLFSLNGFSQLKSYIISVKGDTLNRVDKDNKKQGPWVFRFEEIRGEPGYEEEGEFENDRKEGTWRRYSLMGDLIAVENFRWGNKNGVCQYFNGLGELLREESWRAINPDKQYDTVDVEDELGRFKSVIVKNEGAGVRHGQWKYYDPTRGTIDKTETYTLGKLEGGDKKTTKPLAAEGDGKTKVKPKEVLEFEKKNAGKKKVRVRDGSAGY